MGDIVPGSKVVVNATASVEAGTAGVVEAVRWGWTLREAVVVVPKWWGSRKVTVPLADLSLV